MSFMLLSDFMINFITGARYLFLGVLALCALIIIICVLYQNHTGGGDAITGSSSFSQDSYYSKHKGSTIEEKLNKMTKICSLIVACCVVLYYLTFIILNTASIS